MNLNKHYNNMYAIAKKYSNNYTDLRSFGLLMKDIGGWKEDALLYSRTLQDDLYDNGLLPFKITSPRDGKKLEKCEPVIRDILVHVWLTLCRATGYEQLPSTLSKED